MHRQRPVYRWSVATSVYIAGTAHRTGAGRTLMEALLGLLREQGFRTAYAGMTLPNAGSEGLHRALGFEPVGVFRNVGWKLGRWHDVGWMALDLAPEGGPPSPIRPPRVLLQEPA